ncbi:unnamed protein product, partial [Cyprideis torosa]
MVDDDICRKELLKWQFETNLNPLNYDAWFMYLGVLEKLDDVDVIRASYEKAIKSIPPRNDKSCWRRYIYLWINYAVLEELIVENGDHTRDIYERCLCHIPHQIFTFAKIWLLFAQFEIRQKNLPAARKLLDKAIELCPKDKLFRGYIELELQLREFDRCRILYERFLEFNPANALTWVKFAELEVLL